MYADIWFTNAINQNLGFAIYCTIGVIFIAWLKRKR